MEQATAYERPRREGTRFLSEPPRAAPETPREVEKVPDKFFDAAATADRGDFVFTSPERGAAVLVAGGEDASPELVAQLGKTASKEFVTRLVRNQVDTVQPVIITRGEEPYKLRESAAGLASVGANTATRDTQRHVLLRRAVREVDVNKRTEFRAREIPILWAKVITEGARERLVVATIGGKEISILVVNKKTGEVQDITDRLADQPVSHTAEVAGEEFVLEGVRRETVSHELWDGDVVVMGPMRDIDMDTLKKFVAANREDTPKELSEKLRKTGVTTNVVLRART